MKAVIAIDSFKGHMSAEEAAEATAEALRGRFGRETLSEVDILPASDGGEGFARIVTAALGGVTVTTDAHDPLGRPITASYGFCRDSATAVIECAAASGLTLLTDSELDPMRASSFGTGELIADAVRRGARDIYVGLGGSATVDGGLGLLEALDGVQGVAGCRLTAVCDVEATFCGPQGAAAVYGPQKGATPEQVPVLDERLRLLAARYRAVLGRDPLTRKGAGAAGGMAGAIWAALGGDIRPGADAVLDILRFEERLTGAGIVVTGEGHLDAQTFQGKLPYVVARRAKAFDPGIKVIAYVGISDFSGPTPPFDEIICRDPS